MLLVVIAAGAGMIAVIGGLLVHVRDEVGRDAPVTWAVLAMLAADTAALVASGSYWRDYLLVLVPSTALAAALLVRRRSKRGRAMRAVVAATAVSSAISLVVWGAVQVLDLQELDETDTGAALAAAAEPGDTLTVFGGRADLQLTSGMDSPYPYLWSLPMRTLDPDLEQLRRPGVVSAPAHLVGGVGLPRRLDPRGRAPRCARWSRSTTSRWAARAATTASTCAATSNGPRRNRAATAEAASSQEVERPGGHRERERDADDQPRDRPVGPAAHQDVARHRVERRSRPGDNTLPTSRKTMVWMTRKPTSAPTPPMSRLWLP